jgi:hypothetical protein
MKLHLLAMVLFLLFPTTAAYCSRRHRRTLSASAKKTASVAGCLSLRLNISRLAALFFLPPRFNPRFLSLSSSLKLQVTSNPA